MTTDLTINLDRSGSSKLTDQIRTNIRNAIQDGRLASGTRLPSWRDLAARAVRAEVAAPNTYPDSRGEPALRAQIASYLTIARGFNCSPDQIVITGGYRAALNLAVRALAVEG